MSAGDAGQNRAGPAADAAKAEVGVGTAIAGTQDAAIEQPIGAMAGAQGCCVGIAETQEFDSETDRADGTLNDPPKRAAKTRTASIRRKMDPRIGRE